MGKPIFVVLDYSASKVFTHHWKSIETFCNLLTEDSREYMVLVPKYAEKSLFGSRENVERTLISTDFGPSFREMPSIKISNELIKRYLPKLPIIIRNKVRKLLLAIYTRDFRKKLVRLCANHERVTVLVPSVEPLSVFSFLALHNKKIPNLEWRLRLIGSQERGLLSGGNETELLQTAVNQNPRGVRIGYETFPYQMFLQQKGFQATLMHWSPFPSEKQELGKEIRELFRLGFLGSAKERKGFESIPSIVDAITSDCSNVQFLVQEAVYPWKEYSDSHQKLSTKHHVKMLPSALSDRDLTNYVSKCDLIILPYDPESYALAASAILYHAADLHVPVMCPEGVGFAKEIEEFKIGLVYKNFSIFSNFPETLAQIKGIIKSNYTLYNEARDESNRKFLFN